MSIESFPYERLTSPLQSPFDEADPAFFLGEAEPADPALFFGEAEPEEDEHDDHEADDEELGESEWGTSSYESEFLLEPGSFEEPDPGEQEAPSGILGGFTDLVRRGMVSAAVLVALAGGDRDEGRLTGRVFHARHPELGGRRLRPDERALATEWLQIRDRLVRPLLQTHRAAAGNGSPPHIRQRMKTQQVRDAWAADLGRRAAMRSARLFGLDVTVNEQIAEAAEALGRALETAGYHWAGGWSKDRDAMHFQVDVTPAELARGLAPATEAEELFPFDSLRAMFRKPTLGFEFDVHYGLLAPLLPVGVSMPANGTVLSTHTDAVDGFRVKLDGPRLEIATKPFEVTADGRAELTAATARIRTFAGELLKGCRDAAASPIRIPGVTGAPRPFMHPAIATFPVVKLPIGGKFTTCSVWAAPQATLTVKLGKVAELVKRIKASEGKGPGVALSGGPRSRMGLRSEALYRAAQAVAVARRATPFSADLEGFLILLVSYLWAGELTYNVPAPGTRARPGQDYEPFGKAYLPINVKAPWSEVFGVLLDAADQKFFRDNFADGAARLNLFRLVRGAGATLADGGRKFLPPGPEELGADSVYTRQAAEFAGHVPTWDDLVEHALDATHRGWGDRLMVPLSHKIEVAKTRPRVALELRRAGFDTVDHAKWDGFMTAVFKLTQELNR